MSKIRFTSLLIGSTLILVVIVLVAVFKPAAGAKNTFQPSVGMGDLHRYEAQQRLIPMDSGKGNAQSRIGMGDLRLLESQQAGSDIGSLSNDRSYVGMGDLHLFEWRQEQQTAEGK